jgi:hypothetical protein
MGPMGLRDCPIGPFQSSYDVDGFRFVYVDTRLDSPLYWTIMHVYCFSN